MDCVVHIRTECCGAGVGEEVQAQTDIIIRIRGVLRSYMITTSEGLLWLLRWGLAPSSAQRLSYNRVFIHGFDGGSCGFILIYYRGAGEHHVELYDRHFWKLAAEGSSSAVRGP